MHREDLDMHRIVARVAACFLIAGCISGSVVGADRKADAGGGSGGASPDAGPDAFNRDPGSIKQADDLPPPPDGEGIQLTIGPFTVLPGREPQKCIELNLPTSDPKEVSRWESAGNPGSHHLILYRYYQNGPAEKTALQDCSPAAVELAGKGAYVYGAAAKYRRLDLPDGIAYDFEAGHRVLLETHYFNYGNGPIEAKVKVNLWWKKEPARKIADVGNFWNFFLGAGTPPGPSSQIPGDGKNYVVRGYVPMPYPLEVFGIASHTHSRGRLFQVGLRPASSADGPLTSIYSSPDWEHPTFQVFDPPLEIPADQVVRWDVTYKNDTGKPVGWGITTNDEMDIMYLYTVPVEGPKNYHVDCTQQPDQRCGGKAVRSLDTLVQ